MTVIVGTLKEIRRYPIKSMEGELLDTVDVSVRGLPGDRAWAVRDEIRGGIRGAKKIAALMELRARYTSPPAAEGSSPAEITLPDGSQVGTGDEDVSERVSKALDHTVTLWPLLPAENLDHYRRVIDDPENIETELRNMFARNADEALPDLGAFPPELTEFESLPGTYFDAFPILIMTQAGLDTHQTRTPDSVFDVRRFRPNLLISDTSSSAAPFPEFEWTGRSLRIGEAVFKIEIDCPRCVMTTHGFSDLPKDPKIMRALVKESGGNLGVYASIETPGRIQIGDTAELIP